MKEQIKESKEFKIIPNNFKSSGNLDIIDVQDTEIIAKLILLDEKELDDYQVGSNVEIFGVNPTGLIYFETKILKRDKYTLILQNTEDFSIIQRREYSRVGLNEGKIEFKDTMPDNVLNIEDISAGGLKIISKEKLEENKYYDITISLSNNMKIDCALAPIRVTEINYKGQNAYLVSGKFVDLENADRIVLVQYAFKIKLEEQNRENRN